MIHLIDRVYLDYAEASPLPNSGSRDPNRYIYVIDRGLSGVSNIRTQEYNLFSVKSFDQLVEKFESNKLLMNYLLANTNQNSHKKLQIFCDEIALVQMLCALWKGIFKNLTVEGAYKLYLTYRDFEFLKNRDDVNFIALDEDSRDISLSYFFEKYWGKTLEEFKVLYDKTEAFVLDEEEMLKIGLEFKIINSLLNPSEKNKAILNDKFKHLFKKNLVKEIISGIEFSKEYLYELFALDAEQNESIHLSNKSVVDYVRESKRLDIILDLKIPVSSSNPNFQETYNYLYSNYNIIKVCTELIEAEKKILQKLNLDIESAMQDKPCSSFIIKYKREPENELTEISNFDYTSNFRILKELSRRGRYNHYLVSSFFSTLNKGNPEDLDCFKE